MREPAQLDALLEDLDKAIDDNIKLIPRVFLSLPAARGLHRQPDVVAAAGGAIGKVAQQAKALAAVARA